MRTTVTLRDDIYECARRRAFEERRSLGDVLSDLVELGLKNSESSTARVLGAFAGQIEMSDDFDDELPEFSEALEEPLGA